MKSVFRACRVSICLPLTILVWGEAHAAVPTSSHGETQAFPVRETACSQPGLPTNTKMQADSIEVANDCDAPGVGVITRATWWGGYIDWRPGDPDFTMFDVAFYADQDSHPGSYIAVYGSVTPEITSMGLCEDGWPCFRYDLAVEVPVQGDTIWFSVKAIRPFAAAPNPYPPKWGRLGDEIFDGLMSMAGSGETGEWIVVPMEPEWDASQEFEVEQPTPTRPATWGALKLRYR